MAITLRAQIKIAGGVIAAPTSCETEKVSKLKEYARKNSLRLQGYDYSRAGVYFLTICTKDSEMFLGKVVSGKMILNDYGKIVECELLKTAEILKVEIPKYVIMPNHVHLIAFVSTHTSISTSSLLRSKQVIPQVVQGFKAAVTRRIGFSLWQRSYFDNIINNEEEYKKIDKYIENNPVTWEKDRFYCI